jgi:Metallo-peptidase family M12/Calx-beta domain/Putative binding domain, N-terminal
MPRNPTFFVLVCGVLLAITSVLSIALNRRANAAQNAGILVQGNRAYAQDVDKVLRRYDTLQLDPSTTLGHVQQTGRLFLPTSTGGFDITLAPHDMRAPHYRAQEILEGGVIHELERGPVRTYKGKIAGIARGEARLTIDNETLEGMIITPEQLYFVEPAKRYSAAAGDQDFIVYAGSDLLQGSFGECGVTLAEKVGKEASRVKGETKLGLNSNGLAEELFTPPRVIDLATEADFEYFTFFGNATNANNEILSIMNQVEGIYNAQFGLQFTIVFQSVWADSADPYFSTDKDAFLDEFTNYWNYHHARVFRDLAHMWTGKSFDGSSIGIAWLPGLSCFSCTENYGASGYGMSERISSTPVKFIVAAHEIGHNLNATHSTGQPGCSGTIMSSSVGSTTMQSFCPFSVTEIENFANSRVACLEQALTPSCTYSLSASGQSAGASGASGSVSVNTIGTNCVWSATSSESWINITSGNNGVNSGTINLAVAPNTNGYSRSGLIRIAEQDFIVNQAASPSCAGVPIAFGQTINGSLIPLDCRSSFRVISLADQYSFNGLAGEQISVDMVPAGIGWPILYLIGPTGTVVAADYESGINDPLRIPLSGFLSLPVSGTYLIESTSVYSGGSYSVTLTSATPNAVQLTQATFSANEGAGRIDISFNRTGVTSGPAKVNYATSDNAGLTNCSVVNGIGSSRCDYAVSVGTLNFAAGETSKTLSIPLVDDSYAEGNENFSITLSNAVGGTLGLANATITIVDNEASNGPNPIDQTAFFVRQQYIDFLGREPDPGGFQGWQDTINNCPAGDTSCDRIHVSRAFFQSAEFQQRGYFLYRFYPTAFGRKPDYNEFIPDLARVSGFLDASQLEAAKVAFINDFMARPAFASMYNPLSNTQYVDTLLNTAGITHPARDFWIAALGDGTRTRAQVLREIAESGEVYNKYYNQAFVVMQYFGYLRRQPDAFYLDWIAILNANPNDSRGMVSGFMNSSEYRQRFGP